MVTRPRARALLALVPSAILAAGTVITAQFPGMEPPKRWPWHDASLPPDRRAQLVIAQLTLDEKAQLLHGMGWRDMFVVPESGPGVRAIQQWGFIPGYPRLGIPDLHMADSVHGVTAGGSRSRYATAFPSAEAQAATWNLALAAETGAVIGSEVRAHGLNVSLGSGVNLVRDPRGGRTFEYKGEDPLLAGLMARAELAAARAQGLVVGIKHFGAYAPEDGRMFANTIMDTRTLRETELLPFEIALRDETIGCVMCAYNKLNDAYACENASLLADVLKRAFGFKGFVISDWGATHSTVGAAIAGLDVEMPGDDFFGQALVEAVKDGRVSPARLDDMVHRVLRTAFASGIVDTPPEAHVVDVFQGFDAAQKVADEGSVLLRNAGRLLPLTATDLSSIAVIGGHADKGVLSGGGSSQVSPAGGNPVPPPPSVAEHLLAASGQPVYHRSIPLQAIAAKVPGAIVRFDAGDDVVRAATLARESTVAIVFAVQHASEGMDLADLSLPDRQDDLIAAVAAANPRTVVVLETGGPVTMPWIDQVGAVLEAWYPGIRGAEAIADILFGDVNPSGRLPLTFPRHEADLPHPTPFRQPRMPQGAPAPSDGRFIVGDIPALPAFRMNTAAFDVTYTEGLKVGYKWFDAEQKAPLFPFGYGLSYTTFAYTGLTVGATNGLEVTFDVTNTGPRAGADVAQVYLTLPAAASEPPRRLVGFEKVTLAPGERRRVTVRVEPLLLSIFDADADAWAVMAGEYTVWVGRSSRDLPLSTRVTLGRR